ncbi:MAG: D-glycero-beta-D-manno-heptose 1-phosphate adenylyltransferase [Desulfobacterales bacterium]|nr:D-glycero-beta-D-manno-heptose 1-phosphate adenylyltransferase [Desulfobacterales bacterium]
MDTKPMQISSKVIELNDFLKKLKYLRQAGKRIVFTNGCFDILHIGHVRYLQSAKAEGDILVIGLNSDRSVHIIKGEKRPVIGEQQRAEVLASVGFVDYVILFDEPDPHTLIAAVAPDVLVKGADWAEEQIVGADVVKAGGGRVVRVPVVPDVSTSQIIEDIIRKY